MKFLKRNALFLLGVVIIALSVSACSSQQTAETKPVNNSTTTQPAMTTQQNPASQPNTVTEKNTASKEPEIEISLPANASSAAVGTTVAIPIAINSKSSKEIFSYSFAVMFDPSVLQPTDQPISTTGTLSEGFTVAADTKTAGRLGLAAATTGKTVKTNGTLLNTHFKVIGKGSEKKNLTIAQPVFEDSSGTAINVTATMKR
ncbi:MAG TPA: cohesin domain-containing protein [Pyrinomonadaceae bacterium]|nr:cohesin domain-containing protein [Pyrinomonadaceae bacterium]